MRAGSAKKRVIVFISLVAFLLLLLPLRNLLLGGEDRPGRWWHSKNLYDISFLARMASAELVPLGLSIAPERAIVGYDGWLFLGDHFSNTLTESRLGVADEGARMAAALRDTQLKWRQWFAAQGVGGFALLAAPNKSSLYPEKLPAWARPKGPSPLDAVAQAFAGSGLLVDPRGAFLSLKRSAPEPLYFKQDTHWNAHTGTLAAALLAAAATAGQDLPLPALGAPEVRSRQGGDILRLLRLTGGSGDLELLPRFEPPLTPVTEIFGFPSKQKGSASGQALSESVRAPRLLSTVNAMNDLKVLWLHDSFGNAMTLYLRASFTEVLQLHWEEAFAQQGRPLVQLVEAFKPDLIFLEVVERDLFSPLLRTSPPAP